MRMYDIIQKKRDGGRLTDAEIRWFISEYVSGRIPDYQASALCMAIYFCGMTAEETTTLTLAIRDSGEVLDFSGINGIRADKHSTGGVGDKTSLVVIPVVSSLGIKSAKMSGRGLGHTGGTVDKLEAIEGFKTNLSIEKFEAIVNEVGCAIVGQSADLAPADKMLYALRDVTATVDSMPLIASSIMGKKLAADDDCIVLDVKTGSGAFMKTLENSRELAELMVDIGKRAGKKITALITNMDAPLGNKIGNTLEVIEAIEVLNGKGPEDLIEICVALSANILFLADKGILAECEEMARKALTDGSALETFAKMVAAQGGDAEWIYHPEKFPKAAYSKTVLADRDGFIARVDTEGYGVSALLLGAGRNTKEDVIDMTAGIVLRAKTGDFVKAGDPIAELFTSREETLASAEKKLLASTVIEETKPKKIPLILDRVE
ncbi:MAG: thymidine phosphorylase [Ruminococcaceae bacterium]|nr:thymidine phosphorylase [Oscillospiraceae bacterium]